MTKKLTKHGNSMALVIDRPILDLLKIDRNTQLEIFTDGNCLVVVPQKDVVREARFKLAIGKINRKYAKVFKKLAD
ncbi:MAG: AbrB/MazE/SpoVT family DNA-binding domain-containing protein [Phycisphaerae bacterium]